MVHVYMVLSDYFQFNVFIDLKRTAIYIVILEINYKLVRFVEKS